MKSKLLAMAFLMCAVIAWWASGYDTLCMVLVILAIILSIAEWVK